MTTLELGFLIGLWEGEGCFSSASGCRLMLTISMSDKDVIASVAVLMNRHVNGPYTQKGNGTKPLWRVTVFGREAALWMLRFYAHLGLRRQARIRELLRGWSKMRRHAVNEKPKCHPEARYYAKSQCQKCYMDNYNRRTR